MPDIETNAATKLMSAIPRSRTIFHYTSQNGLLGIIKDKALWLSSILHLSDATEFGYAVELVRTKLTSKLEYINNGDPRHDYYSAILKNLDKLRELPVFVGSFSEQADLLSQWRAYAHDGVGFSIGFEYEHLKAMAERQGFAIIKCIYEKAEQDAILEDLINLAETLVKDDGYERAMTIIYVGLFKFAPALKDNSFFEEQEWRVVGNVVQPTNAIPRFRAGKSMLIPYLEYKLAPDDQRMPISRVIVGPTPHMGLSISSLGYHLKSSENVEPDTYAIVPSRVPYRSW
jgi:hypothetical protein